MQQNMQKQTQTFKTRINHHIRSSQVQLIDADGNNIGIIETYKALKMAQDLALDLIEINPKAMPPIAKIADFGKLQYAEAKKNKEAKKKQKSSEQKQIEMGVNIDAHDIAHKMEKAKQFLLDGNRVRLLVKFRGRAMTHTELGIEKLNACL